MIRYVILNGPPSAGKSNIAVELMREIVRREFYDLPNGVVIMDSFAAPMKHFISVALGQKYNEMDKEKPRAEINGYSVREFLIDMAEHHLKRTYGQDVFGRWLVHRSLRSCPLPQYCIVDDCGFVPEADAVPNKCIIKVLRDGKTFVGDSRGYHPDPHILFRNNGTLADMWVQVKENLTQQVLSHNWK